MTLLLETSVFTYVPMNEFAEAPDELCHMNELLPFSIFFEKKFINLHKPPTSHQTAALAAEITK